MSGPRRPWDDLQMTRRPLLAAGVALLGVPFLPAKGQSTMSRLDPTPEQIAALRKGDPKTPMAMLNLFKFRERALYPAGMNEPDRSGFDAYMIYGEASQRIISKLGGRLLFGAPFEQTVIGDADDTWDMMALVYYPSRASFLAMIAMPDYRRWLPHRVAGLERTRLYQFNGSAVPVGG